MTDIRAILKLLLILAFGLAGMAAHGKMYHWEDEQGNVFYSDQVPPKFIKFRREALNKKGRTIDIIEAEKTKEQRKMEKRLQRLKKEQEKMIAKQKSHDKVLLSTFRSVADMELALKGKKSAFNAQIKALEGNLYRLQMQLKDQQNSAAEHERNGRKVPKKLLDAILATKQQIILSKAEINNIKNKRNQVEMDFAADIERFKYLTQTNSMGNILPPKAIEIKAANELGLFICKDEKQCQKAWEIARNFVKTYSTVRIDFDTEQLIMGSDPITEDDFSLSVSKMIRKNSPQQIFLDIRCRMSSLGEELCSSQKIRELRYSFRPFIESALSAGKHSL